MSWLQKTLLQACWCCQVVLAASAAAVAARSANMTLGHDGSEQQHEG